MIVVDMQHDFVADGARICPALTPAGSRDIPDLGHGAFAARTCTG